MREKRDVISFKHVPMKPPIALASIGWLLMDRLATPEWAYGVFWAFVGGLTLLWIFDVIYRNSREPKWKE